MKFFLGLLLCHLTFAIGVTCARNASADLRSISESFGDATDVFLAEQNIKICEVAVSITPAETFRGGASDGILRIAKLLDSPIFLPRLEALRPGVVKFQVGSVKYGTSTRFRIVVNRACDEGLYESVADHVHEQLPKEKFRVKVNAWRGQKGYAMAPEIEKLRTMSPGAFFRLYQAGKKPSECVAKIEGPDLDAANKDESSDVRIKLSSKMKYLLSKYRHPIFNTIYRDDTIYVLLYNYCDDPKAVIENYLASAKIEGINVPGNLRVGSANLTDEQVENLFALFTGKT